MMKKLNKDKILEHLEGWLEDKKTYTVFINSMSVNILEEMKE